MNKIYCKKLFLISLYFLYTTTQAFLVTINNSSNVKIKAIINYTGDPAYS